MSKKYYFIILILLFSIGIIYFLTLKTEVKIEKVDDREMTIKIDSLSARVKKLEEILSSKHENQQDGNEKLDMKDDFENDEILQALDTTNLQKEKPEKEKLSKEKAGKKKVEKEKKEKSDREKKKDKDKKSIKVDEKKKKKKAPMED
jgi:outer membrane biosynthesis protein TonB